VLAAYRSIARFLVASLIVAVVSGMAVWLFQSSNELTVGASGLIFGYFGYVLLRGVFDRNLFDIGVGLVAGALYWTILTVAIPGTPGVSWIGHLGGLVGGVLAAWMLRSAPALRGSSRQTRPVPSGAAATAGPKAPAGRPADKSVDDLLNELKNEGL
jgi:membrane associated rhomboid family serine protease